MESYWELRLALLLLMLNRMAQLALRNEQIYQERSHLPEGGKALQTKTLGGEAPMEQYQEFVIKTAPNDMPGDWGFKIFNNDMTEIIFKMPRGYPNMGTAMEAAKLYIDCTQT